MSASSRLPDFDDWVDDKKEARTFDWIWDLLRQTDEEQSSTYDVDREWDQLAERLDLNTDTHTGAPASERRAEWSSRTADRGTSRSLRQWRGAVAAVVGLILCVGIGAWWWSQPVSVQTSPGEQTVVSLPDGSTVELNGATTLSYSRSFAFLPGVEASARRVTLKGEAFFSVVSRDRPFEVETSNARVEVLGTEFSVQARTIKRALETRVVVASGRVRLAGASESMGSQEKSVTLERRGEASWVRGPGSPTVPEVVEMRYVEAWRQGGFAVFDAPLPSVLRELERRFGTSLTLAAPAGQTEPMSLHYARDVELETVLRDICFTQNLSFHETSDGYKLVPSNE